MSSKKSESKSPFGIGINIPFLGKSTRNEPTDQNTPTMGPNGLVRNKSTENPNQTLDLSQQEIEERRGKFQSEFTESEEPSDELTDQTARIEISDLRNLVAKNEQPPVVTVRVISGADILKYHVLKPGDQMMIGREEQCELHLNNIAVSKKHAVINYTKNKVLSVIDVGSTNGTFVNHTRIDPMAPLKDSDYIEIGDILLQIKYVNQDELEHMKELMNQLQNAQKDPLTDLFRRDYLESGLPKIVEQRRQLGDPISCAFVDLDRFKPINDTYGHQVGDKVLQTISSIIRSIVRKNDPCIRYGGDEMVIIFPKQSELRAAQAVERIRHQIAVTNWEALGKGLKVSASFGVAELRPGETIDQWMNRADIAAYAAKDGGRNGVRTYGSLTNEEKKRAYRRQ